jgi:hypothetical protein
MLNLKNPDLELLLSYSDVPRDYQNIENNVLLDAVRDSLPLERPNYFRFISEETVLVSDATGREFEYSTKNEVILRMRVFIVRKRMYRITCVSERGEQSGVQVRRFLDSIQFEN